MLGDYTCIPSDDAGYPVHCLRVKALLHTTHFVHVHDVTDLQAVKLQQTQQTYVAVACAVQMLAKSGSASCEAGLLGKKLEIGPNALCMFQ